MTLTFHVGLHKTGTTYLQREIFPRLTGIQYSSGFNRFPTAVRRIADPGIKLISSEKLSGHPLHEPGLENRLHSFSDLAALLPGANIIVVLREPSQWLTSLYRQHIQAGGTASFKKFAKPYLSDGSLDFHAFMTELRKMEFGEILALDSADLAHHEQFVVDQICDFLTIARQDIAGERSRNHNVSVRRLGARAMLAYNRVVRRAGTTQLHLLNHKGLRASIQRGALSWLNRIGADLISDTATSEIREAFADNWQATKRDYLRLASATQWNETASSAAPCEFIET